MHSASIESSGAARRPRVLSGVDGAWELHDGVLVEKPGMGAEHGVIPVLLGHLLLSQIDRAAYQVMALVAMDPPAGPDHAFDKYLMLSTISGVYPGTDILGVVLPLNWDAVTSLVGVGDEAGRLLIQLPLQILSIGRDPHRSIVAARPEIGG